MEIEDDLSYHKTRTIGFAKNQKGGWVNPIRQLATFLCGGKSGTGRLSSLGTSGLKVSDFLPG
jgi:hypothetical protein